MFVVKIFNKNFKTNPILTKSIDKVKRLIATNRDHEIRTVTDMSSVEIISGNLDANNEGDEIIVEMMIKKVVRISPEDLESKLELDKFVKDIEHFCDQASQIEGLNYIPITFRK